MQAGQAGAPARRWSWTCPSRPSAGSGSGGPALSPRSRGHQLGDRFPLVDSAGRSAFPWCACARTRPRLSCSPGGRSAQDVEPGCPARGCAPTGSWCGSPSGLGGLPAPWSWPRLKGRKSRVGASQPGGHVDLVGADGEVHQRPPLEGEQRLLGRVAGSLGRRSVLYWWMASCTDWVKSVLSSSVASGDAVDKEHQVDAVLVVEAVVHLAHHSAAHLLVAGEGLRVEAVAGLELAELEAGVAVLEAVAQERERAVLVHQLGHPLQQQRVRCRRCARLASFAHSCGCVSCSQPIRSSG